ncbi:MAG: hypothetical protein OHK0029_02500 [Armatimonadaceae bacterium]
MGTGAGGAGKGQSKGNKPGSGAGQGGGGGNGIGTGAGTPTTKKGGVKSAGAYQDPSTAPASNRLLNRETETHTIRDDQFNRLFAPGDKGNSTRVKGKIGKQGKETVSYTRGAPDKASATVPYYEVYGQYAPAAEKALNREDIPVNYKKQVKQYFDSLRPADKTERKGKP